MSWGSCSVTSTRPRSGRPLRPDLRSRFRVAEEAARCPKNPGRFLDRVSKVESCTYREERLDFFLEVDFWVPLRLTGLLVRLEAFLAEDFFPRVAVLFDVDPPRPLVFFELVLPPARRVLEPDRAVFRRRASAPTPAVPAAPAAAPRRGPAAFFAA